MRSKIKAISFNLDDHIENFMFEYACELKKNKQSFSGLMKNLLMGYLINTGNPPPGIKGMVTPHASTMENAFSSRLEKETDKPSLKIKATHDRAGIKTSMPFSLDDDE